MNDYDNMSPADREASIRRAYDAAQRNINTLVSRLAEEYRILEDLRDLIAEIDIYGADRDFLCIKNENWQRANHDLTPYGLQLYLYFASNKDNYSFYLSQEAAEKDAGIRRTTFRTYINLMIEKGYLVHNKGGCFDFYETPRLPQERPQTAEDLNLIF